MKAVGLKVLKNRLSEYIRMVESGETVLVTDRDTVVAEIRPPSQPGRDIHDLLLAEAVRKGWVTPPLFGRGVIPPRAPIDKADAILGALAKDRGDR